MLVRRLNREVVSVLFDLVRISFLASGGIHTDAEFASSSIYGQRVVFSLLGLSIATGLLDRLGVFSGSAMAMLGIEEWSFLPSPCLTGSFSPKSTLASVPAWPARGAGVVNVNTGLRIRRLTHRLSAASRAVSEFDCRYLSAGVPGRSPVGALWRILRGCSRARAQARSRDRRLFGRWWRRSDRVRGGRGPRRRCQRRSRRR